MADSAPRPRLFLHIGINKTGTSAIQQFLAGHDRELSAQGVLYPQAGREALAHYGVSRVLGFASRKQYQRAAAAGSSAGLAALVHRVRAALGRPAGGQSRAAPDAGEGGPPGPKAIHRTELERQRERLGARLARECAAGRFHTVVVSSEHFVRPLDLQPVREFFSGFDVRIVVYLRRHDHWWLSAYSQAVKTVVAPPWGPGAQAFIDYSRGRNPAQRNYRLLVDRWAEAFGAPNIIVRPYEAVQNPGGVVADFLRTIGLPGVAGTAARDGGRVNESLATESMMLLDLLQRTSIGPAMRARLAERLYAEPVGDRGTDLLSPALRRTLIDENSADYAYIARTYLGREDGRLFLEPEPAGDGQWQSPPMPDTVEVLSRMIGLLEKKSQ